MTRAEGWWKGLLHQASGAGGAAIGIYSSLDLEQVLITSCVFDLFSLIILLDEETDLKD